MEPSSRTPEGMPNLCPVCGHKVLIEPSSPAGDAPCPFCGHLLWFSRMARLGLPLEGSAPGAIHYLEAAWEVWVTMRLWRPQQNGWHFGSRIPARH
jgi:hypothetical protein